MSMLEEFIWASPFIPIRAYNIGLKKENTDNYQIEETNQIKEFDSTYHIYPPYQFEESTGELYGQFSGGTLRESGNYKNNEVDMINTPSMEGENISLRKENLDDYVIPEQGNISITIELLLGFYWNVSNSSWEQKTFNVNDKLYSGILSNNDKTKIESIGLHVVTESVAENKVAGTIGAVEFNNDYQYDLLSFYSDQGNTEVSFDKTNFLLLNNINTPYNNSLIINSIDAFNTSVLTYKIRISKKNKIRKVYGGILTLTSDIKFTTYKSILGIMDRDVINNS